MAIKTTRENLGKYGVKNGKAYEGKIGFVGNETVVKWYEIKGHKGCQVDSFYNKGLRLAYGKEIVTID
jgi:hypothetical protein